MVVVMVAFVGVVEVVVVMCGSCSKSGKRFGCGIVIVDVFL
jgi:hypothetical protein